MILQNYQSKINKSVEELFRIVDHIKYTDDESNEKYIEVLNSLIEVIDNNVVYLREEENALRTIYKKTASENRKIMAELDLKNESEKSEEEQISLRLINEKEEKLNKKLKEQKTEMLSEIKEVEEEVQLFEMLLLETSCIENDRKKLITTRNTVFKNDCCESLVKIHERISKRLESLKSESENIKKYKEKVLMRIKEVCTALRIPNELSNQTEDNSNLVNSVIQVKQYYDTVKNKLESNIMGYDKLITSITKKQNILKLDETFQPIKFDEKIYSDKYLQMMEEYDEKLSVEMNDRIDRVYEKVAAEEEKILSDFGEKRKVQIEKTIDEKIDAVFRMSEKICELEKRRKDFKRIKEIIEERKRLIVQMEEFEKSASDPKRLFKSSFQLVKEEKFRKNAFPNLVKLEDEIFHLISMYEKKFSCLFYYEAEIEFKNYLKTQIDNRSVFLTFKNTNKKRKNN